MRLPTFVILVFLSFASTAQDAFTCDSIFIDCCQFGLNGDTEINLQASNYSSDIVSYPGFILYTESGDTIAKEVVNYFGIGFDFQAHLLQVINAPSFPFEGYLELYAGFYDSLYCTFPISIEDPSTNAIGNLENIELDYYPNPTSNIVQLDFKMLFTGELNLFDSNGQLIKTEIINGQRKKQINLASNLAKGIYIIQLFSEDGLQQKSLKLHVE